jgi:type IV secretory pathway VirB6-like protein
MISTVTTTTMTLTQTQVMSLGVIAVISLIVFLALKEILSSEAGKNPRIQSFLNGANVAIIPLLLAFMAIVAYKILSVS